MSTDESSGNGFGDTHEGDRFGPSDPDVIRRVLDGHRDEYKVLIRRYQERFHRFAHGMVDDYDAATDLVQDSFVKAYTSLESCENPARFESWAYQILRNRCRDYLKNIRRSHERLDDRPGLISEIGRPEADLDRSELRRMLRDALACLPGAHREAFLLKHLHGHTYPEIAEMLGASESAVKMRVHRSRELLQAHIEKQTESRARARHDVTGQADRSSSMVEAFSTTYSKRAEA